MRNWKHEHTDKGITLGDSISSTGERQIILLNPTQKRWHDHCFVLWFGAYGWTRLHVYADHLEDALDECVDWIAEHEPGLLADEAVSDEYNRLHTEAVAEGADPDDESVIEECHTEAEVDTTCAGNAGNYLNSWEWGLALEDPTTEQLYQYVRGL